MRQNGKMLKETFKDCEYCGDNYRVNQPHQKYCGKECSVDANNWKSCIERKEKRKIAKKLKAEKKLEDLRVLDEIKARKIYI